MTVQLQKRRFNVEQYHQMVETGILSAHDRIELIRGEIFDMSPIGRKHAACVRRLIRLLSQRVGEALLDVQDPIELDERSEPQPDVVLLRPREDFYETGHPQIADILLIIEVADSSLDYDQDVKIPAYAEAGVAEVWLVDLNGEAIAVHRDPSQQGYRSVQQYGRGESIGISAFPETGIAVDEVLG
ncbi:MAG: Uma2 family endonuclease [Oculatellaceae cyanobacterium Prado106]|jgi:Uma2 family endonuclease|nr:Uma2 family endonuclease [Oculatellaceae cyanobacterium Prado106]